MEHQPPDRKTSIRQGSAGLRSLDQFYRYIEQREGSKERKETGETGEEQAPAASVTKAAASGAKGKAALRYVLRNGVTIPVPIEEEEAALPPPPPVAAAIPARDDAAVFPKLQPSESVTAELESGDENTAAAAEPGSSDSLDAADAAHWRALPAALRTLSQIAAEAETLPAERRQLIERLLNPLLSLEDAARLLGVHPGTVRRWANKGVLPHQRTVGQQRRFHLTDVLECQERRAQEAAAAADKSVPRADGA